MAYIKETAKQRIADELEVVRDKLTHAGHLLGLFVDDSVSDQTQFGDIRQNAFEKLSKDEIQLISQHLNKENFDKRQYEWQYIDSQYRKISNSIRPLFLAIDIECEPGQTLLSTQLQIAKSELQKEKHLCTADQRLLLKQEKDYIVDKEGVNYRRFEYYLYQKVSRMLDSNHIFVNESAKNKRLEDDLIPITEWKKNENLVANTGLDKTTSDANDVISDSLAKLPIFKHYTINESTPFGSIDGQKHACRINTFKARFSAKYFRKGKGVSALTLVSNHVPINTKIISANEYEGHHAFDLLYNNSSDIQPKALATDTHGVNNVNFAILDLFGYQFAPRYAKFKYVFHDLFEIEHGEAVSLKLHRPFNTSLIKREWENIQRIICSLSRKTTTQSTIITKLSNGKQTSRTLAALREYDRIIKCLYVLDYVDDKVLRQFVQQALNRGEAYHQLRRAIASINGNQFRGGNDYQIDQWNDCARIIANCIIYYNSALLSSLIEKFEQEGNQEVVNLIAGLSPVAWRHIQLAGNYTFGIQKDNIVLEKLLENLEPWGEESMVELVA